MRLAEVSWPQVEEVLKANPIVVLPHVLVRIPLTRITAWEGLDWHPRYL